MDESSIFSLIALAFALGLIHALDADHIMAVSNLIGTDSNTHKSLQYCAHWALGHGLVILALGGAALILGTHIPESIGQTAEWVVGFLLIGLGLWTLRGLQCNKSHVHFHRHDQLPEHAHWHQHRDPTQHHSHPSTHQHTHQAKHKGSALIIGCIHGMAGSAPILALIPLSQSLSPWQGMVYLLVFVLSVLLAMLTFGGIFSHSLSWLYNKNQQLITGLRLLLSSGCVLVGISLLPRAW